MTSRQSYYFWLLTLVIHVCAAGIFFYLLLIQSNATFFSFQTLPITLNQLKISAPTSVMSTEPPETKKNESVVHTNEVPPSAVFTYYLPASQLDVKPQVVRDIDPDLLENFRGVEAQWLNLIVLINEYGDVDQVIFDTYSNHVHLPDSLVNDLKQRFMEARFLPGRIKNQSVASELRIRVHLE
jgi:hypothetical protein